MHGRRAADTVAALLPPGRRAEAERMINTFEVEDAAAVTAIAGAADLVATVPRWAVATSGRRELALARLRAAALPVPAVLVAAEDVRHGKPHPEGYLAAARRLGVDPADTVVVEDAAAGVAAARAAGVGSVRGRRPAGARRRCLDRRPDRCAVGGRRPRRPVIRKCVRT